VHRIKGLGPLRGEPHELAGGNSKSCRFESSQYLADEISPDGVGLDD
jgi:hypothetical protein